MSLVLGFRTFRAAGNRNRDRMNHFFLSGPDPVDRRVPGIGDGSAHRRQTFRELEILRFRISRRLVVPLRSGPDAFRAVSGSLILRRKADLEDLGLPVVVVARLLHREGEGLPDLWVRRRRRVRFVGVRQRGDVVDAINKFFCY